MIIKVRLGKVRFDPCSDLGLNLVMWPTKKLILSVNVNNFLIQQFSNVINLIFRKVVFNCPHSNNSCPWIIFRVLDSHWKKSTKKVSLQIIDYKLNLHKLKKAHKTQKTQKQS